MRPSNGRSPSSAQSGQEMRSQLFLQYRKVLPQPFDGLPKRFKLHNDCGIRVAFSGKQEGCQPLSDLTGSGQLYPTDERIWGENTKGKNRNRVDITAAIEPFCRTRGGGITAKSSHESAPHPSPANKDRGGVL
jgi:hypothetical protein